MARFENLTVNNARVQELYLGTANGLKGTQVLAGEAVGATFTIGTEAANAINVAVQLTDINGDDLSVLTNVNAFLSDDSDGIGISGTAPATSVAIGTDGAIVVEQTAKLAWQLQTETDGKFDLTITETGAKTWYLVVVLPNGKHVVSDAITFAT